jgi:HPt (histidine-containing phosphotransfer) domain-containing protein
MKTKTFITANIMKHDREIYFNLGMNDCVGKPFVSQELWRCLLKFLTPVDWEAGSKSKTDRLNNELFDKLTTYFVRDNKEIFKMITGAIEAGDIKLAHRLVHTLKSSAGILGKETLQKTAEDIELKLLKNGDYSVSLEEMNNLEEEINTVLNELAPYAEMQDSSRSKPGSDTEAITADKIKELLAELLPLLENGDPACLKFLDSLHHIQGCEELIQQMENMDFVPAAKLLKKQLSGNC